MQITPQSDWTLTDLFLARVQASPDSKAYRWFDGEQWVDMTWAQAAESVGRWQAALAKENLKPGDRVGICSRNRIEWMLFDQAALGLGLVVVPLFYNDRPDNMAYCLTDAGAKLLLLEDGALWKPMSELARTLERVVCLNGTPRGDERAVSVKKWLPKKGVALQPSPVTATDLATLVYTSGTTGRPKGVMLSHRNILSNTVASLATCPIVNDKDRFLSFLPLSHMLERTAGYYLPMLAGAETAYARGIPELAEDMVSQQPTLLICVPRIFERIYTKVQEGLPPGSPKRKLFEAAVNIGWRRFNRKASLTDQLLWPLLDRLVASKLKARMGGRIRLLVVGAAALAPQLGRTFIGLGLPIIQGYGLTEASPVVSVNRLDNNDPASVGPLLDGVEARTLPDGELLVRGPCVMLGYWNNPAATRAVLDADGWLHTGDVARIENGRIYITGRAKDIIVLTNGEKVSPGDIEQAITQDTAFEQVMLVGEGRPYLGLLVVSKLDDPRELCRRANAQLKDFPGYARIRHLARVSEPWTVENGMLTPTLKCKRNKIDERYAKDIEAMYQRTDVCNGGNGD
jgi:long-chain acyl-CoA synthetase